MHTDKPRTDKKQTITAVFAEAIPDLADAVRYAPGSSKQDGPVISPWVRDGYHSVSDRAVAGLLVRSLKFPPKYIDPIIIALESVRLYRMPESFESISKILSTYGKARDDLEGELYSYDVKIAFLMAVLAFVPFYFPGGKNKSVISCQSSLFGAGKDYVWYDLSGMSSFCQSFFTVSFLLRCSCADLDQNGAVKIRAVFVGPTLEPAFRFCKEQLTLLSNDRFLGSAAQGALRMLGNARGIMDMPEEGFESVGRKETVRMLSEWYAGRTAYAPY